MLDVEGLQCERDGRVLFADLGFSLTAGAILQIEGANGAGKSTLLRALAGLLQPSAGTIRWQGQPIAEAGADYRAALLYLGHKPGVKGELSPTANLRHLLALHGQRDQGLDEVLAGVGLAGLEQQPVARLSAGQQRRVALARLWLKPAPLWLLDEPFTALDKRAVAGLTQRFEQHLGDGGAIIVASHQDLPLTSMPLTCLPLSDYAPLGAAA